MIDICIIAGGKGTRSLNPDIPKSLQVINTKPLIDYQLALLDGLSNFEITFLLGYGSEKIKSYINSHPKHSKIFCLNMLNENKNLGTFNAARFYASTAKSEFTLYLLGDLFFKIDYSKYFNIERKIETSSIIFVHPTDHPNDSDLVDINKDFEITSFKLKNDENKKWASNNSVCGIFLVKNEMLLNYETMETDLTTFLLKSSMESEFKVDARKIIDIVIDTGTPDRIRKIDRIISSRNLSIVNKLNQCIFIDLDDTLLPNLEIKNTETNFAIHPEIIKSIKKINGLKIPLIVVSNQPGIAKNYFSELDFFKFRNKLELFLSDEGVYIDDWFICPHHPESGWEGENKSYKVICNCRKPKIGLFERANNIHNIALDKSFFLGNSDTDQLAADTAGIRFARVINDYSWNKDSVNLSTSKGLLMGIDFVVNY